MELLVVDEVVPARRVPQEVGAVRQIGEPEFRSGNDRSGDSTSSSMRTLSWSVSCKTDRVVDRDYTIQRNLAGGRGPEREGDWESFVFLMFLSERGRPRGWDQGLPHHLFPILSSHGLFWQPNTIMA